MSYEAHERFTRLLLEHEPAILRCVLMFVPDRVGAREVLQDTAVALWRHFAEYDENRPFVNWACAFARIEVRRFCHRRKGRLVLSEEALEAVIAREAPDTGEWEQRDRHLKDCIARLPLEHRALINGYYFQERTVESLAEQQGRTVAAIYKALQRVRQILFECVQHKMNVSEHHG